jgi:hypothetical protein
MPRTPPNHGTAKFCPLTVSLARFPAIRSEPGDQLLTLVVMLDSAPWVATPGVSVLPSSVMSGPPLPLVSALVQSVVLLPHGIQLTTTFGLGELRELLVELLGDAVHPGDLRGHRGAHPPDDQLGRSRRPRPGP